ncbi:MAG: hypothetical protein HZB44_05250 [Actinobacteria bacterium]|nr:hypothetical protein [Actinomycetota bacterium]
MTAGGISTVGGTCAGLRITFFLLVSLVSAMLLLSALACDREADGGPSTDVAAGPDGTSDAVSDETGSATESAGMDGVTDGGAGGGVTYTTFDKTAPGYITFVINVHDTVHVDESADTILRLIGIYEKYGVRGDFYLTAPIVQAYSRERPDVIERLKNSEMTISYHVRPPHPLYAGFDQSLQGLDGTALAATLQDYETFALDMTTGGLLRDQPGGYSYVADTFGRDPVCAPVPSKSPEIKAAGQQLYANLGAHMTLLYHEEGTDLEEPFVWVNGLLVRPSDFSITRWDATGSAQSKKGEEPFWWNMLTTPNAGEYDPTAYLQERLAGWNTAAVGRPPIITSLIHENNFARSGPEGWTAYYFTGGDKSRPLSPPFDLTRPESSTVRSAEEQEAIWAAYEEMVAWASANLRVVTSEDIVTMAGGQ